MVKSNPPPAPDADEQFKAQVQGWLKGHPDACRFIEQVTDVAHCWDDLTDRDRPIQNIHQAFWDCLIALPRNPFYAQHFALLNGLVQQAILNWHIANTLETTGEELDEQIAFILRSSYVDLITACAWILGGETWAIQVGTAVRRQTSSEGFALYRERLATEHRTAGMLKGV